MDYAKYIDHTLLKMDATEKEICKLCDEAKSYHFYSVCVNPCYVPLASKLLRDSTVKTCTVIGFPLGASLTSVKVFETRAAIEAGADEIDMVINVGWLKSGDIAAVKKELEAIKSAAGKTVLKVILEICLLTQEEIKLLCQICQEIGVDFVKTSTGFSFGGATVESVRLMRETVGPKIGVKASGGIRDTETARQMIEAGATRLGSSASIGIVTTKKQHEGDY